MHVNLEEFMCGISGIYLKDQNASITDHHLATIQQTLSTLRFRGPDEQGMCQGRHWIFGHTRLAILDLGNGQQPMTDPETGLTLIYNGEIYNYRDIRKTLSDHGVCFRTQSDTEVVLHSYRQWGEKCVDRFNGCFAFAVADPAHRTLFAARDRLGIKPLFYHETDEALYIASSIPAMRILAPHLCRIKLHVLSQYLTTGRTHVGENTLVDGIRALQPGSWLRYTPAARDSQRRRYWRIPVIPQADKSQVPFEDAVEECAALLEDAVRIRLVSDVPIGAFVSGGLDSAIICHIAARFSDSSLPLFCAGTDVEAANEYHFADLIGQAVGTTVERECITPTTFTRYWSDLIRQKGLPLSTPNEVSIFRLAAALRRKCAVTLTGEGADEVFGGYVQPHFSAYDYDRCPHAPEDVDEMSPFALSMIMKYGRAWFINDTDHYLTSCSWFNLPQKHRLLTTDSWEALEDDTELFACYETFFDGLSECSTFDKRMHLFARFNLENLLFRVDSSTMAASVEARVPFNDHRLVEFAFAMPDSFKMDWRDASSRMRGRDMTADAVDTLDLVETKRLPRHAFQNALPAEIVKRKKMSFPVPFNDWFATSMCEEIRELCSGSDLMNTYFRSDAVSEIVDRGDKNLWLVANLCRWWQDVNDPLPVCGDTAPQITHVCT